MLVFAGLLMSVPYVTLIGGTMSLLPEMDMNWSARRGGIDHVDCSIRRLSQERKG